MRDLNALNNVDEWLNCIDSINWDNLTTAYHEPKKVPSSLKGLLSGDPELATRAVVELDGQLQHQASVYDSSFAALPLLIDVLTFPDTCFPKSAIVSLCQLISTGYDLDWLYCEKRMADTLRDGQFDTTGYVIAEKRIDVFVTLLNDRDFNTRVKAAYLLAWFPTNHRKVLKALRTRRDECRELVEQANLTIACALLEFNAKKKPSILSEATEMLNSDSYPCRCAGAIYCALTDKIHPLAQAILEALAHDDQFFRTYPSFPFYGGDLSGYAARTLDIEL